MAVTAKSLGLGAAATALLNAMGTAQMVNAGEFCRLSMPIEYAGVPTNEVTPDFQGQLCTDTTNNDTYVSIGTAAANWEKLTS